MLNSIASLSLLFVSDVYKRQISDQGFEVTRRKKADIKRFLAIYVDASMNGDLMPDYDGEQYISDVYKRQDTFYTNSEGYLITPETLSYGKGYSVVEVQAPYGLSLIHV